MEAFIKQPKLQFTIDCLVKEFQNFQLGECSGYPHYTLMLWSENQEGAMNGAKRGAAKNAKRPKNAGRRGGSQLYSAE